MKEKERLKNRRERELKGETVEPESDSKELELNVDPLQVIEFKHVEAKVRNLPIRIELLIFLAFFGVFVLSFRNRKHSKSLKQESRVMHITRLSAILKRLKN
ncbi:MAG: hypothetical protein ACK4TA_03900 [Saprospiraceae bacterium]